MRSIFFIRKLAFALAIAMLVTGGAVAFSHATKANEGDAGQGAVQNSGVYENTGEAEFDAPIPGSYELHPIKPAGDGNVLTHTGRDTRLKTLMAGRISIVSFIYTSCDDVKGCPLATAKLFDLHDLSMQNPDIAKNARLISLSFDPETDTPEVMKSYGYAAISDEDAGAKMPWDFLTTKSRSDINSILKQYGQVIDKRGTGSAISHLLRVYLVDRGGQVRNIYGLGFLDQRLLIADIRTLLLEEEELAKSAVQ